MHMMKTGQGVKVCKGEGGEAIVKELRVMHGWRYRVRAYYSDLPLWKKYSNEGTSI